MTVEELILQLQAFPQDSKVLLDGAYDGVRSLECLGLETGAASVEEVQPIWNKDRHGERVVWLFGKSRW